MKSGYKKITTLFIITTSHFALAPIVTPAAAGVGLLKFVKISINWIASPHM